MEKKLTFKNKDEFRDWLLNNHDTHGAVWLVFGKGGRLRTLHPDEALKEALCFGWIDGLIKRVDDDSYIKRFSHRNKISIWSGRNKAFAKELIKDGRMTEHGLEEIERARENGRWNANEQIQVTDDDIEKLINAMDKAEPALTNFLNMSPSVQRTYAMHYLSAKKEETKSRRLAKIIDRLNENLKPM